MAARRAQLPPEAIASLFVPAVLHFPHDSGREPCEINRQQEPGAFDADFVGSGAGLLLRYGLVARQ
jgi:hypothetical protein